MPLPDPSPALHQPPMRKCLELNQDAHSIIYNQRLARHDDDVHRAVVRADDMGSGWTIEETGETCPRRGHRPDDRSPSHKGPGPGAFDRHIQRAPFPQRFRPPTNITKYSGETNPGIWLEDFWLAYRAGGVDDDYFIIRYLPICVGGLVQAWLEFLPHGSIRDNADLKRVFIGNFQGMYVRPGNSWDLKSCQQEPSESLQDYIRRFSQ